MEFRILGPLEVRDGDRPLALGGAKQRALLALLLLRAGRTVSMDELVDLLWPDSPREEGVKALQVAISRLRRALGTDGVLATRAPGYELRVGGGELDAARFERLAAEGRAATARGEHAEASRLLREALALWRGPPLADLAYHDACRADVERLDELRLAAQEDAAQAELELGRGAELVGDLERLVASEPLRERPRAQLMLALYRAGRQADALEAYRAARDALVDGLGVEPGRELRELHRRVLEQDPSLDAPIAQSDGQGGPPPRPAGIVGRERELAVFDGALADARRGRGTLVLVGGEPGIGKSRLVDALRERAADAGARVLSGRCWEAGGAPAYWPWVQALRGLVEECDPALLAADPAGSASLATILPEVRARGVDVPEQPALSDDDARFRLFDATARLLRRAGAATPLVVTLDDLHAGDVPSMLLLRFVAGELEGASVVIVATYRDVELRRDPELAPLMGALARSPVARPLALGGLAAGDVAALVESLSGSRPSEDELADLHERTDGNPLFVTEMTRLAATAPAARSALPPGVREVIRERLRTLSPECTELLATAALLGRDLDVTALCAVAGVTPDAALDTLAPAMDAGVLARRGDGHGLRFSHILVAETIADVLPPGERMRRHARIGEALVALYGRHADRHLAELAHHFAAASAPQAAEYALRAGDRAVGQLAFEEAVRLYALGLSPDGDDEVRAEMLLRTGETWARAGDAERAKEALIEAAAVGRAAGLGDVVARAAIGFGGRVLWPRAATDSRLVPLLEDAIRALGDEDSALRVQVLARLATAVRGEPTTERRERAIAECVATARRLADPALLAYALEARCLSRWWPGHIDDCWSDAREVLRIAVEIGDLEREYGGHENAFYAAWARGEPRDLQVHAGRVVVIAETLRQPVHQWEAGSQQDALALSEGRFDDAEAGIARTYAIGARAVPWSATAMQRLHTYLLLRLRGGLEAFEPTARASATEYADYPIFAHVLADVLARLGREEEARGLLASLAADHFAAIGHDEMRFAGIALLGEAAASLGDVARAAAVYDELRGSTSLCVVAPIELCLDSVSRVLGRLAATLGRPDDARRHFDDAIAQNERLGASAWVEVARRERAEALGRANDGGAISR